MNGFQFTLRQAFGAIICFSICALAVTSFLLLLKVKMTFQLTVGTLLLAVSVGSFFTGVGILLRDSLAVTTLALTVVGVAAVIFVAFGFYYFVYIMLSA